MLKTSKSAATRFQAHNAQNHQTGFQIFHYRASCCDSLPEYQIHPSNRLSKPISLWKQCVLIYFNNYFTISSSLLDEESILQLQWIEPDCERLCEKHRPHWHVHPVPARVNNIILEAMINNHTWLLFAGWTFKLSTASSVSVSERAVGETNPDFHMGTDLSER